MSASLTQMVPWIDEWVHPGLHGGLPTICGEDLLNEFMAELQESVLQGEEFFGSKEDLSKCFDRVSPEVAIALFEQLGADLGICHVCFSFMTKRAWYSQ